MGMHVVVGSVIVARLGVLLVRAVRTVQPARAATVRAVGHVLFRVVLDSMRRGVVGAVVALLDVIVVQVQRSVVLVTLLIIKMGQHVRSVLML